MCWRKKVSKAPKIAAVISLMICPSMVFLTFNGFVDIGGLLGCLVCFNLYFVKDKDDDAIWRYAVIGLLLVALCFGEDGTRFHGIVYNRNACGLRTV